jgi:soluble lytic murein transglycosylase-like protein
MSGYSDQQIEDIIRGHKSLRQVQRENKTSITANHKELRSVRLSCRKRHHPLVSRYMKAYVEKYHRPKQSKKKIPNDSILQSIKERYLYHKKPPRTQIIEQIKQQENKKKVSNAYHACHSFVEKARPYLNYIEDASFENNIKQSLIMAIIKVESGFNHRAVSPKGALGLMQLMPFTAKSLGVTNPFDPMQNIHGGTRYFSKCLQKLQNIKLALAAYNAGLTRVERMAKIPPFRETQNFVKNVLRYEKLYDRMIRNL